MAVTFRLLGGVAAQVGDRVVDVGHARQRCVLAALLVDANRVLPMDELVERVWADRPPRRARTALAGYVSRLRRVLAGADDVAVTWQSGGYSLAVDPMAVDLHRFRHLVAQARAADGEEHAAALFEEALGLWRGEAFATLDTPWLTGLRSTLDAERLAVELDRNDLELRSGRHAELVGELAVRAAAQPLDERLAGQLMLALCRCGQQAEALRRYEGLRVCLAEELGVDPSPPLRLLHQQILTGDEALALPAVSVSPAPSPVPKQLPAPPRGFAGRLRELAALDVVVAAAGAHPTTVVISAVSGTAGVGKSALAVHWAHRMAGEFGDGQLFVNLRGFDPSGSVMEPAEAIRGFLDALAVPQHRIPPSLDAQAGLYRSLLAGRRMLVLLDNARDVEQVRPLLPGSPGCVVLVTSRNQLTGLIAAEGAHPLAVDLLTDAEARDLLAHRLGTDRVAAEPDAVDTIVARCARLPLALAVVAARAAIHPDFRLAELADELDSVRDRLDAFPLGDRATEVRTVFSWSYRALRTDTARLFRLLALQPGPHIGADAAASLAGLPLAATRRLLAELASANLISEPTLGRYSFHDLLRDYARQLAHGHDADQLCRIATHRMLDHYLHTAHTAALLLHPHRDPITLAPHQPGVTPEHPADSQQALAWLTTEHPVLLAAIEHAADTGFDTHAWQLAWTMWTFLDRQGHWQDMTAAGHTALAAAVRLADPTAQASAHRLLGSAARRLGSYDDAHRHLHQALTLYRQSGDLIGEANSHNNLSNACEGQHRYQDALHHAQQALDLYRATGHQRGHAHGLNSVGWYHSLLGDHQQAITICQQALTLLQHLDDRVGQAMTWHSLGHAHHHLGNPQQAIAACEHALRLFRQVGDRSLEADTLTLIGDTHHLAGNLSPAHDAWHQALTILDELDHPDADRLRAKIHPSTHRAHHGPTA